MIRLLRSILAIFCFTLFGAGAGVISFVIFPFISLTKQEAKQKEAYSEVIRKSWSFFSWIMSVTGVLKIHTADKEKFQSLDKQASYRTGIPDSVTQTHAGSNCNYPDSLFLPKKTRTFTSPY